MTTRPYYPVVIARLRLRLSAGDVHDVAQNTMLRLSSELQRGKRYPVPFRVSGPPGGGLDRPRPLAGRSVAPRIPVPPGWDIADQRPEHSVEGDEWVRYVIAPLPERDRKVATLRYLDGMEIQQIADDLPDGARPFPSGFLAPGGERCSPPQVKATASQPRRLRQRSR